jgi:mono/diheme cytochrome c family protein
LGLGEGRKRSFFKKRTKKLLRIGSENMRNIFFFITMAFPAHAWADAATVAKGGVTAVTGAEVYQHVCQGCHMPGGRGAVGAAAFPKLADNPKLAVSGYPVSMVLNGNGGMPWFNGTLSNEQIAAVVNYVRTHFGNHYSDAVSPADVAAVRGPTPIMER